MFFCFISAHYRSILPVSLFSQNEVETSHFKICRSQVNQSNQIHFKTNFKESFMQQKNEIIVPSIKFLLKVAGYLTAYVKWLPVQG